MEALCRIELLGGLRLLQDGRSVTRFRTRKTAELLAYLACFRLRMHPREVLIDLLWPEKEIESGRHSLSMALSSLRPLLEPPGLVKEGGVLCADRHAVGLNPMAVTTDVSEFETAVRSVTLLMDDAQRSQALATAVDLYGGEFLPGYYEEWIFLEQQRLEELFSQTLHQSIAYFERLGDLDQALQYALRLVHMDRLREEAHREVMRLYMAAGQPAAALRQYRRLEQVLHQEMDVTPSRETRLLIQALRSDALQAVDSGDIDATARLQPVPASSSRTSPIRTEPLEPVGGAVPLTSKFYVERPTDDEFRAAILRRDSIVLVKGARQVGKTSLLARGLQQARQAGAQVVLTHFQVFNASHFESTETLLLALAETIAEQLDLEVRPGDVWDTRRGPSPNFRRYLRREALSKLSVPLVWGLDEVDRLFACSFGNEIFGLFRSWHDERALEPDSPWDKLTLAIAYSTEAHLFITDVNQSPFNVGTRLTLADFTKEQVADLNRRYGSPLEAGEELDRFHALVNGHPYLVRRGLHEMAARHISLRALEEQAAGADWIFGEHLRRITVTLARNPDLIETVRATLEGKPCPARESFYRLRSAGVLIGESVQEAQIRCPLYAAYLRQNLL